MEDDSLEKSILLLSKQMLSVEQELVRLNAGLVTLKSLLAMELHRENPKAFLEQLHRLEERLLAEKDTNAQARKEAGDVFDVLLREHPKLDDPDA
jgi:uncharacterized membrane protein YccC